MDDHDEQKRSAMSLFAIIFGTISAGLGSAAEATVPRLHEVQKKVNGNCTYPQSPALGLGIAALATLVVYRFYCPRIPEQTLKARLCYISSWVAWLAGMGFYVAGLVMIIGQGKEISYNPIHGTRVECHVVKPGIYAAGASFASLAIVFEIIFLFIPSADDTMTSSSI